MAIIITEGGKNAQKLEPSEFDGEDELQRYVSENPQSLPLAQLKEDAKLLVIAREFGTASGPIDVLAIDRDGDIYVIETKLYKNPDKRKVVAQMLDYGAALWSGYRDADRFIADLHASADPDSFIDRCRGELDLTADEAAELILSVKRNLIEGNIKFMVLMDSMNDRLRDLISFINTKSQFDIYAVELQFYRHGKLEIAIPRLFGSEIRKDSVSRPGAPEPYTEARFLLELNKLVPTTAEAVHNLCTFSAEIGRVEWKLLSFQGGGKANVYVPSLTRRLYSIDTEGNLLLDFNDNSKSGQEEKERFKQGLRQLGFAGLPAAGQRAKPEVRIEDWAGMATGFKDLVRRMARP